MITDYVKNWDKYLILLPCVIPSTSITDLGEVVTFHGFLVAVVSNVFIFSDLKLSHGFLVWERI